MKCFSANYRFTCIINYVEESFGGSFGYKNLTYMYVLSATIIFGHDITEEMNAPNNEK